jgi:hypothetical protein
VAALEAVKGFFGGLLVHQDVAFEPPGEGDEELVSDVFAGGDGDCGLWELVRLLEWGTLRG